MEEHWARGGAFRSARPLGQVWGTKQLPLPWCRVGPTVVQKPAHRLGAVTFYLSREGQR